MKLDDEELVALFNDPLARAPGAGCPEPDAFRRAAMGEVSAKEREEFVDHLVSCADCAEEYRVMPEVQSWALEAGARKDPGAARGRPGFPLWISAVAAAVLAAAGLALWLRPFSPSRATPAAVERGPVLPASAVGPPDRAFLRAPPPRLAWAPVAGAEGYEVALFDFESTPLWQSPLLGEPEVSLPDAVRERLQSGGRFFWRVTTHKGIDRVLSGLHEFTVSPGVGGDLLR
jgi:hypothetical protein